MTLRSLPYTLQLKNPFTLAAGSRTETPAVIVRVDSGGVTGYGEASMPPYLGETVDGAVQFLARVAEVVSAQASGISETGLEGLDALLNTVDRIAPGHHAAKAAVDIALHDWLGKVMARPCREIMGIATGPAPVSSYTIGIGDAAFIRARLAEAENFPVLKMKLGGGNDREIIRTVRSCTGRPVRVDANQGWGGREEAAHLVEWLAGQGVELVEQPFPRDRYEDTAWLRERSPLPLVADESVVRFPDLKAAAGVFDGVNIKLMKCTGIAEAHRMITESRRLGLRVMLGCMTETSCGISAAAQLASLADWTDLDGALLISNDPFSGASVDNGRIIVPDRNGIGVTPILPLFP